MGNGTDRSRFVASWRQKCLGSWRQMHGCWDAMEWGRTVRRSRKTPTHNLDERNAFLPLLPNSLALLNSKLAAVVKVELRYVPPTAEGEEEEEGVPTKILLPPAVCWPALEGGGETPFLSLPFPCVSRRRRCWEKNCTPHFPNGTVLRDLEKRACSSLDCNQGESEWTEAHLHEEGPPALEKYFFESPPEYEAAAPIFVHTTVYAA